MMYMYLSLSLTLSIIFLFLNHPLSMGLILFLQAILMCLISGSMSMSFWFSYILLLIYLGGMLILFMYVTSLASNEMFSYSNKIFLSLYLLPLIYLFLILSEPFFHMSLFENMESTTNLNMYSSSFLLKLYNQPMNNMTILVASYLFLTLIAVVKMITIHKGPLRQLNN
uniref:NADH-ubiquinone oxidoreductase chain 6 n=1 Tax=Pliacanthopus bimaculatus TaxID=2775419 RepID=A0A7L8EYZ1_9NEOP|nr:NADH dehydrogenase subunit 6 [Pliacanthopus bimaculatus]ASY97909.1 NADH dehydrogenase subunit 6 [Miromantis yunnanensis]QOE17730.1 NADH dehydrogenase subunit 6 [Pliacanthopus bimaculatus]